MRSKLLIYLSSSTLEHSVSIGLSSLLCVQNFGGDQNSLGLKFYNDVLSCFTLSYTELHRIFILFLSLVVGKKSGSLVTLLTTNPGFRVVTPNGVREGPLLFPVLEFVDGNKERGHKVSVTSRLRC